MRVVVAAEAVTDAFCGKRSNYEFCLVMHYFPKLYMSLITILRSFFFLERSLWESEVYIRTHLIAWSIYLRPGLICQASFCIFLLYLTVYSDETQDTYFHNHHVHSPYKWQSPEHEGLSLIPTQSLSSHGIRTS